MSGFSYLLHLSSWNVMQPLKSLTVPYERRATTTKKANNVLILKKNGVDLSNSLKVPVVSQGFQDHSSSSTSIIESPILSKNHQILVLQ